MLGIDRAAQEPGGDDEQHAMHRVEPQLAADGRVVDRGGEQVEGSGGLDGEGRSGFITRFLWRACNGSKPFAARPRGRAVTWSVQRAFGHAGAGTSTKGGVPVPGVPGMQVSGVPGVPVSGVPGMPVPGPPPGVPVGGVSRRRDAGRRCVTTGRTGRGLSGILVSTMFVVIVTVQADEASAAVLETVALIHRDGKIRALKSGGVAVHEAAATGAGSVALVDSRSTGRALDAPGHEGAATST